MKNYLEEIEQELKRLELISESRKVNGISNLLSFLLEDAIKKTFYITSVDMEEEKEYLRIDNFFKNHEQVEVKKFESHNGLLKIELEVNGQIFKRECHEYDESDLSHPFFELLVEMNAALNGSFLAIPKLGGYVFCGIYIENSNEAERLQELFDLYAITAVENAQLSINV